MTKPSRSNRGGFVITRYLTVFCVFALAGFYYHCCRAQAKCLFVFCSFDKIQ